MQYTQVDNEPRLLELIHHEEGRVVPKADGSGYAYHYDLRDHLGNTRVTFSSETTTDEYLATMEPELANDEEALFGNVAESRQLDQLTNSTEPSIPTPDPQYSARLNATQGKVVGPAKSLPVKKDDRVNLSVDAFYFGTDSEDNVGAAAILPYVVGAFTGQGVVDGQALSEAIELGGALLSPALFSNNNGGIPYAYLNFMFFDENFVYRPLTSSGQDYVPVTDAAQQNHEALSVELTMPTSGYLYVYVSNESNWNINVFFDELNIEHEHSPVIADESYYPFGLAFNQQPDREFNNKYLWSGKERQTDLNLNWDDFGWRNYDPALGRFHTQDRFADKYHPMTPYQYAANNPTNLIDVNGDSIWFSFNRDKRGELTGVTLNVTGKVINTTDSKVDINAVASDISKQIKSSYQGEIEGVAFSVETDITGVESMEDVSESDHVFALADVSDGGIEGNIVRGASNEYGGKVGFISVDLFTGPMDETYGNMGARTAAHELGHLLNIRRHSNKTLNLMKKGGLTVFGYNFSTQVSHEQRRDIFRARNSMNIGVNFEVVNQNGILKKMPDRGRSSKYIKY